MGHGNDPRANASRLNVASSSSNPRSVRRESARIRLARAQPSTLALGRLPQAARAKSPIFAVVGLVRADSLLVPAAGKDRRRRQQEDARVYLTDSWVV